MVLRRPSSWIAWGLVMAGVAFASSGVQAHPTTGAAGPRAVAGGVLTPNFAAIERQNARLFAVRRATRKVAGSEQPLRIRIPTIGVDSPIINTAYTGVTWQTADWAVGYMVGSAQPGRCTTWVQIYDCVTALAAHNDIKGEIFKRTKNLKNGDKVYVYTRHRVITYTVSARYTVSPTNSNVLFSSRKSVALVTCTPYWIDTSRLVVMANLTHTQRLHR